MNKQSEVINELEWIINDIEENGNMEYAGQYLGCIRDAIEYLKAQLNRSKREPFLPCRCGCNQREHWYSSEKIILKCKKCGFHIEGDSEADARRKWNEAVRDDHPRSDQDGKMLSEFEEKVK